MPRRKRNARIVPTVTRMVANRQGRCPECGATPTVRVEGRTAIATFVHGPCCSLSQQPASAELLSGNDIPRWAEEAAVR